MDKRIGLVVGLTALFAMGSAHAQQASCPTGLTLGARDVNDATGHVFEVWRATGITWEDANACAIRLDQQTPPSGATAINGHLATITSSEEDQWVEALRLTAGLTKPEVWVGGQRLNSTDWSWVNNEGPIETGPVGSYQNWLDNEPNNLGGFENHLAIGLGGNFGWNDEGNLGNIGGFVVEYDYPRTVNDGCTGTGGATSTATCGTVEGQTLTFPPGTFTADSKLTFSSFEFRDPRVGEDGKCNVNRGPLVLFDDPAFDGEVLEIPAYLCGSPKFIVVRAQGENINIPKGVVVTENNTIPNPENPNEPAILPGNLYGCDAPIPGNANPQEQDVGVWQTLDPTQMWEDSTPTSVTDPFARFAGAASELTTGCGSTLLKSRSKSYFVVGLHIDFDLPYVSAADKAAVYAEFVALTQYKISLVRQSVVQARTIGSISNANGQAMLSQLNAAAAFLDANDPVNARKQIEAFLSKVKLTRYLPNLQGFNYNGDHLSRGENILFTLKVKIIPYKPLP